MSENHSLTPAEAAPGRLLLPDPKEVSLVEVRGRVIPAAAAARQALRESKDVDGAQTLRRGLEAFRKWLQDREGRDLLAAECRRTEVLIGHLLGPGVQGQHAALSPVGERAVDVPREDRRKFRLMAAHEEAVEKLLAAGMVSRNVILGNIQRKPKDTNGECCEARDLHALAASGRKFGCIYADPPWKYGNQSTRAATDNHYLTMTVEEIAALPVGALAAECCHLHLWTTNAFLFECPKLLAAWGFDYQGTFVWCKSQMGIGNCWRVSHELMILAIKGEPRTFRDHSMLSYLVADRGQHSAKPEQVRRMIERGSPGPYLELFGREAVAGWTVWGNAVTRDLFTACIPSAYPFSNGTRDREGLEEHGEQQDPFPSDAGIRQG